MASLLGPVAKAQLPLGEEMAAPFGMPQNNLQPKHPT
jgi:hypothetical protein